MAGSTYGKILTMTTWGESHGVGVGVVVDGCPAGLALCEEDVQRYLDRRKPGQSRFTTKRSESDTVEILSGVFEGRTTGTPISMLVRNQDQHSKDYSEIASYYRPGHADYTFDEKYGFRDYRGGGRSSGRETIGRVAAGAIAAKLLESLNIRVKAYTKAIGPVEVAPDRFDLAECEKNKLYMPDAAAAAEAEQYLERKMAEKDSAGGIVECVIAGLPAGLGEPVFDKFNANLAKAICSIGAVKGFEIGEGFHAAQMAGSENNDAFVMEPDGSVGKATNHAGGILGGMTDGSEVVFRAAFKPTPSIAAEQRTVNKSGEEIGISIKGRHDPIIVPRAVVVVETMAAFAAAVKIDSFAYLPVQDFGNAFSTFVAQNHGAHQPQRIRQGIRSAGAVSAVFCLVISGLVCVFAAPLMSVFIDPAQTQIIQAGVHYLRIEGACYIGIGMLFLLYGYYRAVERPAMSVVLTIASLGTRVALAYALSATALGVTGIWLSVPIGWALADGIGIGYYFFLQKQGRKVRPGGTS